MPKILKIIVQRLDKSQFLALHSCLPEIIFSLQRTRGERREAGITKLSLTSVSLREVRLKRK